MKKVLSSLAVAMLVSTSLSAQTASAPAMDAVQAAASAQSLVLNSGTPITLAVIEEVTSTSHREGDIFKLTVLNDVKIGETVVIPRGTPARGEITWRTGKGAFGKSGKIEFALTSIDLNGKSLPVSGNFRQDGEGNTIATGIGVLAVGVFAGFITGKRARLPAGRELMSTLADNVPFESNGKISSSFDWQASMAAAELKTPIGQCKAEARKIEKENKRKKALEDCYEKRIE